MPGTRSFGRLPVPVEWRSVPGFKDYLAVFCAAFLVVSALMVSGIGIAEGDLGPGIGALIFALAMVLTLVVGVDGRIRPFTSSGDIGLSTSDDGHRGLLLPYSRIQFVGLLLVTGSGGALFMAWGLISTPVGVHPLNGGMVFFAAMALLMWSFLGSVVARRVRLGWLLVSGAGVYQRGWAFESFLPWESIVAVGPIVANDGANILVVAADDEDARWRRRQIARWWRQDSLPPVAMLVVPARNLGIDVLLVYHLLDYYHRNPAARAELGTRSGLERAQQAAF